MDILNDSWNLRILRRNQMKREIWLNKDSFLFLERRIKIMKLAEFLLNLTNLRVSVLVYSPDPGFLDYMP